MDKFRNVIVIGSRKSGWQAVVFVDDGSELTFESPTFRGITSQISNYANQLDT